MTRSCIITHDGNCIDRNGKSMPFNPDNSNSLRTPLDATDRPGVPSSLSPGRPFKQVANV